MRERIKVLLLAAVPEKYSLQEKLPPHCLDLPYDHWHIHVPTEHTEKGFHSYVIITLHTVVRGLGSVKVYAYGNRADGGMFYLLPTLQSHLISEADLFKEDNRKKLTDIFRGGIANALMEAADLPTRAKIAQNARSA